LGSRDARSGSADEHINGGVTAFRIIMAMTFGLILPAPTARELAAPAKYESGANVPSTAAPFKKNRYTRHIHTRD
jgi:hypothetical protein